MSARVLSIVMSGDLVLDEPDPDHWLSGIAPVTPDADLCIGHLEVPHTHRPESMVGDVPAPGAAPDHLAALSPAGFHVVTLAGNHIADCGGPGIAEARTEADLVLPGLTTVLSGCTTTFASSSGAATVSLSRRGCVTCHQPADGMSLALSSIRERWRVAGPEDPLFAAVDGADCPNLDQQKASSHSLLLEHGLRGQRGTVSVYRWPRPATNLKYLTAAGFSFDS